MKLLCSDKLFFFFLFSVSQLNATRIAFYYGSDFPVAEVNFYEKIVVQPENIPQDLLMENPEKFFAYFSLEEKSSLPEKLTLGSNKDWNNKIGDLRKEEYQKLVLEEIKELKRKGFKNFFIDTIDSYLSVINQEKDKREYEQAIVNFIAAIREMYPDSEIMLNRGFEIMKDARKYASFLVAESLYFGIDTKEKTYRQMPPQDSIWLKEKLNEAKDLGYEVFVIDYLPKKDREKMLSLARKIKADGFNPYISDYNLMNWGQTEYEQIPREVIIFYDSKQVADIVYSQAHRLASLPLEYHGYVPKLRDIREPLPADISNVHGIIFLTENQNYPDAKKISEWINRAIKVGKKILFLQYFPFPWDQRYFSPLSITIEKNKDYPGEKKKLIKTDLFKPFEAPPAFYHSEYLLTSKSCSPIVIFENQYGQRHTQAAVCPWGGYAIDEAWIREMDGNELFTFDPYDLFKETLKLRDIPVPDPTTRNGRRALLAHIDGDGFTSLSNVNPGYFNAEILKREILEKYKIPHSVSVIRGELEKKSLKHQEKERIKKAALDIFSMENVEIGNHSFSHPFKWIQLSKDEKYENREGMHNLPIEGYRFNIEEEIIGTKKWLENEFAITGKKNNIFFWTGDCIAPLSALKILKENHMLNINGGYTAITNSNPYQYLIYPSGIERNGYYQIYAGQQNDNVYNDLWRSPFWRYAKVIETFKLTDKPRRVKPINIYYHFFSAEKKESLKALKKVYDYAMSLKTCPVYASKYSKSVEDFYESQLYKYENIWILSNSGELKTLRLSEGKYPEIKFSVAGYQKEGKHIYVNLYGKPPFKIEISQKPDKKPFIKNSSCEIDSFTINEEKMLFSSTCFSKPEFEYENTGECSYRRERIKKDGLIEEKVYGQCD